ncbi:MAG: hypothetical protein HKN82_04550 [Akkermansiaceae bacterium]|nr:hypothetical protein [Akkermansiaceae bacterium]
MRPSLVLPLLGVVLLPACSGSGLSVEEQAQPAVVVSTPQGGTPNARKRPRASQPRRAPANPGVSFRTPSVTSSLVDEKDLLPASPGASGPGASKEKEAGTIIARPPASDSSE